VSLHREHTSIAVILTEACRAICSTRSRWARISKPLVAALALALALPAFAQYPGQVNQKDAGKAPTLRAVAVLEWTGEAGKPKASRIVPITVYDGQQLQDGGLYLSRPEPLAVAGDTEYQLKKNGRTIGLFDVTHSGRVLGAWAGFGEWKPLPKPKTDLASIPKIDDEDDSDDKPVLHRKHPAGADAGKSAPSGKPASDDTGRPTLHKPAQDDSDSKPVSSTDTTPIDPDRPVMKKPKPAPAEVPADAQGNVSSLPGVTDPDRPRLMRGKSSGNSAKLEPTLMGLPPDLQQAVAVSDARNLPDHPWSYKWANPDDQGKMKEQLEDIARKELGIAQPPPAPAPAKSTSSRRRAAKKPAPPPPEAEPAPLEDEQYRVFELAYGSGATLVLTAHTDGALADEKFVTLIAQPDLYGNVLVLFKHLTDGAHLDENPRMRLVDAVDALADNRGELLFELRGATSRQFALYRVLRGQAEKLFVSFGGNIGGPVSD
jgi:hypothetical protein